MKNISISKKFTSLTIIVTVVMLIIGYLRLNNYNTAVTFAPNDKKYILKPVFPDKETGVINPEKVDAAEACSKICCCSGDIF